MRHPFLVIPSGASGFFHANVATAGSTVVNIGDKGAKVHFACASVHGGSVIPRARVDHSVFGLHTGASTKGMSLSFDIGCAQRSIGGHPTLNSDGSGVNGGLVALTAACSRR